MASSNINPSLQKELEEASDKVHQELVSVSNAQLADINRALSQTSTALIKTQKTVEDSRDNIKSLERDLKSLKDRVFRVDSSFVPSVTLPKEEWPTAQQSMHQ